MKRTKPASVLLCILLGTSCTAFGAVYHVDSNAGDDRSDGLSPQTAWQTLQKASSVSYKQGDKILLKKDSIFKGKLVLHGIKAKKDAPVVLDMYGGGKELPKIDGAGYIAAVEISESESIEVRNLEITSDGGKEIDAKAETDRYGVYVSKSSHVSIEDLRIHNIFATIQTKSEGKDGTTAYGHGVRIEESASVRVSECNIQRVGRYGINTIKSTDLQILNNHTDQTGCSGLQMNTTKNVVVQGNTFDHPGSFVDQRMHGRGSGSWVWGCENVLYEKNQFLNAKGKGDSCGVHIDFNCRNVVIQRCFSMNNEGGFIEILGNNYNCSYRYNISVNDGFRKKGQGGAYQEGKVLWFSGFNGKAPKAGPLNSYIYNNTVYVKEGARACFSVAPTTKGVLIANNIFHLLGPTVDVAGDQNKTKKAPKHTKIDNLVFKNNVYIRDSVIPADLPIQDSQPIIGDSGFKNPGGERPEDYVPANAKMLKDKGVLIEKIPGDNIGLTIGLGLTEDFFGNPIKGTPDIGAIEIQN